MSRAPEATNNAPAFQAIVPGLHEPLTVTATSADSQVFEAETTIVELFPTIDMWIQIIESTLTVTAAAGSSGATSYNKFLPGGVIAFLGVPKKRGVQYKIAAVRGGSSNGVLHITQGRA
jgi:hypothetical protein